MLSTLVTIAAEEAPPNPLLPATYDIVWSLVCFIVILVIFWRVVLPDPFELAAQVRPVVPPAADPGLTPVTVSPMRRGCWRRVSQRGRWGSIGGSGSPRCGRRRW